MKLEGTVHCEAPDCEGHQHVSANTMAAGRLPIGCLRVTEYGDSGDREFAFCNIDCVMRWAAQFEPPEVIRPDPEGGDRAD